MSRELFEKRHEPAWRTLEGLLGVEPPARGAAPRKRKARRARPEGPAGEMPALYRQVCHHLALARHRQYGADLERRLNRLALLGHQELYRGGAALSALHPAALLLRFRGAVRDERRLVLLALGLLVVPMVLMMAAVSLRPELAYTVASPDALDGLAQSYAPEGSLHRGRPIDDDVVMFGYYILNNVSIAFRTFAGGILGGVGSVFYLVQNGLYMGAAAGQIGQLGYEPAFYSFVIGHGAFELTAIVLAGAAGLRLGLSVLAPGRLSRRQALREGARRSVVVLFGAAVMLVVAAFLEAFWSSSESVPMAAKFVTGGLFWGFVLGAFALGGDRGP